MDLRYPALCVFAAVLASSSLASRAHACASCACGDTTLTATGVEAPYKNRLRLTLDERYGAHTAGEDTSAHATWFVRSALAASWSPVSRLTLVAQLPWISQWNRSSGGALDTVNGLGDLELSGRTVAFRDRKFAPHHLLWATVGLKFPTGPRVFAASGYPYADDDQPGSGSWDPFIGMTYAWLSQQLVSVYVSTTGRVTTPSPRDYQRGSFVALSSAVQLQPWRRLAFLIGVNAGYTAPDTLTNARMPNTGGFVTSVAPGILINPIGDLLVRVDADLPIVTALYGSQTFGPQARLSVAYDIN